MPNGMPAVSQAERLTINVIEMGNLLGVCKDVAYQMVREGSVPSIRVGRRILVPRVAVDRLLSADGSVVRS